MLFSPFFRYTREFSFSSLEGHNFREIAVKNCEVSKKSAEKFVRHTSYKIAERFEKKKSTALL